MAGFLINPPAKDRDHISFILMMFKGGGAFWQQIDQLKPQLLCYSFKINNIMDLNSKSKEIFTLVGTSKSRISITPGIRNQSRIIEKTL